MKLKKNIYRKFIDKGIPLSDQLAAARSLLATERTFLSYQRTALTFAAAGFTFIKFFDLLIFIIIGYVFIPIAIIIVILGSYRYLRMKNLILNLESESHRIKE
jgi:putative membrane protein